MRRTFGGGSLRRLALALFAALVMALGLCPAMGLADDGIVSVGLEGEDLGQPAEYPLWIGGELVTDDNLSGQGWSYVASTKTLTLDGYSYAPPVEQEAYVSESFSEYQGYGIYYCGDDDLIIVLKGKNSITVPECGILSESASITIRDGGNGSITAIAISDYGCGISVPEMGDVTIEGGIVEVTGGPAGISVGGTVTINGGEVTAVANGFVASLAVAEDSGVDGLQAEVRDREGQAIYANEVSIGKGVTIEASETTKDNATPIDADEFRNSFSEYMYVHTKKLEPLDITGTGHLQKAGDVPATETENGIIIGTTGEGKRLEAISVSLPEGVEGSISYRAHVQHTGWTDEGKTCGTTGAAKRLEAVQMRLDGPVAENYNVWYRVHSQTFGWLGWATEGQSAGTAGLAKRGEAVEVQVLPEGVEPAGYDATKASYIGAAVADVHLQKKGWTGAKSAIDFGTTGQSRRLEAIKISLENQPAAGGIEYDVHVQGKGWENGYNDGAVAGTTGESRRIEAVRIRLNGDMAEQGNYNVWYRVHSQTYGWLGWAHDGQEAGTTGLARRAEAVDVQILPQGQVPNGYDESKAACVS